MTFGPHGFSILQVGQRRAMKIRRDDEEDKVVGSSSQGQKDRRCKLHCTTDTQSPHLHWEGGLIPDPIVDVKTDVCDTPHD